MDKARAPRSKRGGGCEGVVRAMSDRGSSVTLILYSLDPGWMTGSEPFLNLVAAAAQRSTFTHVELAIVRRKRT